MRLHLRPRPLPPPIQNNSAPPQRPRLRSALGSRCWRPSARARHRLVLCCEWCETMPGTPRMRRREFVTLLGTAAAPWPLTLRGQQPATPVIGFLGGGLLAERRPLLVAFRQGLAEAGYVERQNVAIEYLWAEGQYDRLPALAADLVRRQVTVLVAGDGPSALAAKAATTTIPIV